MLFDKIEVRQEILQKRKSLDKDKIIKNSSIISDKIFELPNYKKSNNIMCYIDYKNEIQTEDFIRKSLHLGKRISVPRLEKNENGKLEIKAIYIENIISDLEKGSYGIMEPKNYINEEAKHNEIDMAIVPGVAFDREKNRIGFGKGFYDKYFSKENNSIVKVGLGHDFQVINFFNPSNNDIPMNIVITEKRVF